MRNQDTYRNSGLDRAKPKHRFHAFINRNFKRHRTDTGLVEDSTSSTTVVRIIIGLILVHLIVIGGVLLRGHMTKNNAGVAVAPTITPPPAVPAMPAEVVPQPAPAATAPATPAPANPANHITQTPAPSAADEMVAEEPVTIVNPVPATPATPAAPAATVTVRHLVASGDNWNKVARQYGVTVDALKAANPKSAQKNMLYAGTYLSVPVAAGSEAAKQAEATPIPTAPAAKTYTVKRGDTIGKIARMHKLSTNKLLQINEMTDKDARKIQPGMQLKVSE